MVNITHKSNSLREAIAVATLEVSDPATMDAVLHRKVPKGDVFEFSRAAGLLAVKKTSDVIPDCHPLPVEYTNISFDTEGLEIHIRVEVHTIYKTGVEVEAMHGAAIAALTMYDMLKPLDKGIVVSSIRLESKKGGKADHMVPQGLRAVVVVCSDTVSGGSKQDESGRKVKLKLESYHIEVAAAEIIPDEVDVIRQKALMYADAGVNLLVFVGGTGLSPRDVTPDTIRPLLTREIPGVMETARQYGQQRMPYAMLSRGVSGFINNTLVITLPGSTKGAEETMDAVFPYILHVFKVAEGLRHD